MDIKIKLQKHRWIKDLIISADSTTVLNVNLEASGDEVLLIAKPWKSALQLNNNWIKAITATKIKHEPPYG